METFDAISSRRQVRQFTDDPIPDDVLTQILEAGRRTPSGRNGQPWDFVVVTAPETKATLARCWQGASWTADAPVVVALIIPAADEERAQLMHRFDLGQLAMQLMIAATGFGVASGQASCQDQELARSAIGFPEDRQCGLLLAMGYPGDRPLRPIRKPDRRPFDDVVHIGSW
jgi:nitroreductase